MFVTDLASQILLQFCLSLSHRHVLKCNHKVAKFFRILASLNILFDYLEYILVEFHGEGVCTMNKAN